MTKQQCFDKLGEEVFYFNYFESGNLEIRPVKIMAISWLEDNPIDISSHPGSQHDHVNACLLHKSLKDAVTEAYKHIVLDVKIDCSKS